MWFGIERMDRRIDHFQVAIERLGNSIERNRYVN